MFAKLNTFQRLLVFIVLAGAVFLLAKAATTRVFAEGVYANIGTTNGSAAGADAVSWSQGYPIMIDSYGHLIVFTQQNGTGILDITYSNDAGASWEEIVSESTNRTAAVYDPVNDKIHTISTEGIIGGLLRYRRYVIRRNQDYTINTIELEPGTTSMLMEDLTGCSDGETRNPIVLLKPNGGNGILVAMWSVNKDCAADFTATRASMRTLSNDTNDFVANNWAALDGTSDEGGVSGPAIIDFDQLYTSNAIENSFQHSALISDGGTNNQDIYYFNIDENDTHGFRRLNWNTTDWSGTWTARTTFGGDVDDSQGYTLKKELITKPILVTSQDRVYVGISRYLGGGLGDTQSLFQVAANDAITLVQDLYSAGGGHCLYPTLDIAYDQTEDELYSFYLTTGAGGDCGDVYYKTYDGTTMSTAQTFWTTPTQSVDIPIVYQSRYNDRLHLFYRVNNEDTPNTPPHEIYYGYLELSETPVVPQEIDATGGVYTATTFADFSNTCSILTGTKLRDVNGGEVSVASNMQDDFSTPTAPYQLLFRDQWTSDSYSTGIFDPEPNGQLNVTNPANGAFTQSIAQFNLPKTLEFRANFSAANFQHIGFVDNTGGFGAYIMFSTGSDATLRARVAVGSETATVIGTDSLGAMHTYRIEWLADNAIFYIDGVEVADITTNVPNEPLRVVTSNNETGSNLNIDWILVNDYAAATYTYQSCTIDSGTAGTLWQDVTFVTNNPGGTTTGVETRTSTDGITWSAWSGNIASGNDTTSPAGRYIQYRLNLTSTTTNSPLFESLSLSYDTPPNVPANLGPAEYIGGGDTEVLTPEFTFDLSDPDVAQTVGYQIQIDDNADFSSPVVDYQSGLDAQGGFTFTVGQAEGGGTYLIGAAGQELDLAGYYWRVRTFDEFEVFSAYTTANGGAVAFDVVEPPVSSSSTTTTTSSSSTETSTTSSSGSSSSTTSSGGTTSSSGGTTCTALTPPTPLIVTTTALSDSQIKINVNPETDNYTKLILEYGLSSGAYIYNAVSLDKEDGTEFILKALSPTTRYFFTVRTVNDCAESGYTAEDSIKTLNTGDVPVTDPDPSAPGGSSSSAGGNAAGGFDLGTLGLFCLIPILLLIFLLLLLAKRRKDEKDMDEEIDLRTKLS